MTTERKIEILENCKVLLSKHYLEFGICTAFYFSCTDAENRKSLTKSHIVEQLGDILTIHRPVHIKENCVLWWSKTVEGLKIRISVIDKMIAELKTQLP